MIPALWDDGVEAIDVAPVYWGTSTILTIFFSACLVSALFFALGYSFGGSGAAPAGTGQTSFLSHSAALSTAGSAATMGHREKSNARSRPSRFAAVVSIPTTPKSAVVRGDVGSAAPPVLRKVSVLTPAAPISARQNPPRPVIATANLGIQAGQVRIMVQIAAVRDRKNAQTLATQLQQRGLNARVYAGRHDPYFHVQIGPFSSTSQAQRMQRRVQSSGYRAALK